MNKASLGKSEQFIYNFIFFFFFQLTQYAQEAVGSGPHFRLPSPLITSLSIFSAATQGSWQVKNAC